MSPTTPQAAPSAPRTASRCDFELLITHGDGQSRIVPLVSAEVTVGRSPSNSLAFPQDFRLSRNHLVLKKEGDEWIVRDLGSTNGTEVNAQPLTGPYVLRPGDRIGAGNLVLDFRESERSNLNTTVWFVGGPSPSDSSQLVVNLQSVIGEPEQAAPGSAARALSGSRVVQALIRAGQELAGHGRLEDLFEVILDLSIQSVDGERGVLMTLEGEQLVVRSSRGEGFQISSAVRDRVIQEKASILVRDAMFDDKLSLRQSIVLQHVRSMIVVPLQTRDRVIGLIYVDKSNILAPFNDQDLSLLTVMANVAAIRLEQARLAHVEQAQQEMSRELAQAAEIQNSSLPKQLPEVEGLDIAGHNLPCRGVGGDYYDCIPYRDGRVIVTVGDVSGKGMPAALLMTSLQAMISVLVRSVSSPAEMMETLNRNIRERCPSNRFITLFIAVIDPFTGGISFCNAGHNRPVIVRRDGRVDVLKEGDLILGISPKAEYSDRRALLRPGDVLVLYSDGVTESNGPGDEGEEFGDERLARVVAAHRTESSGAVIEHVLRELNEYTAGAAFADDVTLVVVKRAADAEM
jgi:phosphoserine phosphatase RsbU/P